MHLSKCNKHDTSKSMIQTEINETHQPTQSSWARNKHLWEVKTHPQHKLAVHSLWQLHMAMKENMAIQPRKHGWIYRALLKIDQILDSFNDARRTFHCHRNDEPGEHPWISTKLLQPTLSPKRSFGSKQVVLRYAGAIFDPQETWQWETLWQCRFFL